MSDPGLEHGPITQKEAKDIRRHTRTLSVLLGALAAAALAATGGSAATAKTVTGTVGPGFTIDLADAQGQHVAILTEGKYQLLIHDLADVHNFVLGSQSTGALIASTEVPFVGDMTFTIDLVPGAYAYACAPHFNVMNGRFVVVRAAPPPDTTKSLSAKVTSKAVMLSATRATPGNYKLTVADRSKARN